MFARCVLEVGKKRNNFNYWRVIVGMFDWVDYSCACDNCKSKVAGFQSKSGENILATVKPNDVDEFYSSCEKCGLWIEFYKIKGNGFKKTTSSFKDGKRNVLIERFVKIKEAK